MITRSRLIRGTAAAAVLSSPLLASPMLGRASAADTKPSKVSVAILYLTADIGLFLALDRGYFTEQSLELDLTRITTSADAIPLLGTSKLDVGSGGASPGLFNALRRGLPVEIVTDKWSVLPPGDGLGQLLVRRDLFESGAANQVAGLKGKRIAVNSIQTTSLNYVLRGIATAGLKRDDITLVEMPFSQFPAAFEKKAIDAGMVYAPLIDTLVNKLKLAQALPAADEYKTSLGDSLNIMMFSPEFAKTDAAKRFMIAHAKGQRDYQRAVESKADMTPICTAMNKYVNTMPADCGGYGFSSVDPNGGVNVDCLERYQREWIEWGIMKEPADIRSHVNLDFSRNAVAVLGPFK
jgi:NitT/TauT family transport system substrate-binding protein